MDELTRWYIDLTIAILTFIVSLIVAILLYEFEKKRDANQGKQTEEFNNWMKGQTEKMTSILETLQEYYKRVSSEPERQRLVDRIERFFPGSVQIGNVVITRPSLRLAEAFLGGGVLVEALATGEEGERLFNGLSRIEKGKVVNYISPKGQQFLAEVKSVDIEKETFDETVAYQFHIGLQIKR